MLVLTRKRSQAIYIGDEITVKVLGINEYGQVKIGIDAPKDVHIARCDMIKDEAGNVVGDVNCD
ncbi:MAG: carbon storage regulator [Alphaproteobacteria bacterium]|nr:carbon storage regulator [Alphaproteobacteria bacterium]